MAQFVEHGMGRVIDDDYILGLPFLIQNLPTKSEGWDMGDLNFAFFLVEVDGGDINPALMC